MRGTGDEGAGRPRDGGGGSPGGESGVGARRSRNAEGAPAAGDLSEASGYAHPLIARYASPEAVALFSPLRQARIWRDLWIGLAEEERALGAPIPQEAIAAMRDARDRIDLARVAELERELRHDVMAHVLHFGEVAPAARGYIHLGATSTFVADNASLISHRDGLRLVRRRLLAAIAALSAFARRHRELPALGYTHAQPAQPTTFGRRACLWIQDLVADVEEVDRTLADLRFRGARGTTGTEATFLDLFGGDGRKIEALNERLARRFGFPGVYDVVGQTYPRKVDHRCLFALAGVGVSGSRFGHDVRLLQAFGELLEPFETRQVGSSAMPYKRNPMRAERICALARHLAVLELDGSWTAATQWLERTLDDSANRRIAIPEAYLTADAVLLLVANVAGGMEVREETVRSRLDRELPFLLAEQILLAGVRAGGDRQELHERLRRYALAARGEGLPPREGAEEEPPRQEGTPSERFLHLVAGDPAFGLEEAELRAWSDPRRLVGRSVEQVERFLARKVDPLLRETEDVAKQDQEAIRV